MKYVIFLGEKANIANKTVTAAVDKTGPWNMVIITSSLVPPVSELRFISIWSGVRPANV